MFRNMSYILISILDNINNIDHEWNSFDKIANVINFCRYSKKTSRIGVTLLFLIWFQWKMNVNFPCFSHFAAENAHFSLIFRHFSLLCSMATPLKILIIFSYFINFAAAKGHFSWFFTSKSTCVIQIYGLRFSRFSL